jgi:hypothetical protein
MWVSDDCVKKAMA